MVKISTLKHSNASSPWNKQPQTSSHRGTDGACPAQVSPFRECTIFPDQAIVALSCQDANRSAQLVPICLPQHGHLSPKSLIKNNQLRHHISKLGSDSSPRGREKALKSRCKSSKEPSTPAGGQIDDVFLTDGKTQMGSF